MLVPDFGDHGSRMLIKLCLQAAQKNLRDNVFAACEDDALLSKSAPANDNSDSNILDDFEKIITGPQNCAATLGDLSEVIGEFLFFDDKKVLSTGLDQPKVMKALHKQTDPRPGRADHLGEFFMGNPQFDADAARVLFTHCAGQL